MNTYITFLVFLFIIIMGKSSHSADARNKKRHANRIVTAKAKQDKANIQRRLNQIERSRERKQKSRNNSAQTKTAQL